MESSIAEFLSRQFAFGQLPTTSTISNQACTPRHALLLAKASLTNFTMNDDCARPCSLSLKRDSTQSAWVVEDKRVVVQL